MSHGSLNETVEMVAEQNKPTVPPSGNMIALLLDSTAP